MFSETQKWQNILLINKLENVFKNALGSRFGGANGFYASYGFAFLFYTLSRYRTTLQKLIWGVTNASKKILGCCKIENSLSKVEKCQNILLITKLENVEELVTLLKVSFGF